MVLDVAAVEKHLMGLLDMEEELVKNIFNNSVKLLAIKKSPF